MERQFRKHSQIVAFVWDLYDGFLMPKKPGDPSACPWNLLSGFHLNQHFGIFFLSRSRTSVFGQRKEKLQPKDRKKFVIGNAAGNGKIMTGKGECSLSGSINLQIPRLIQVGRKNELVFVNDLCYT